MYTVHLPVCKAVPIRQEQGKIAVNAEFGARSSRLPIEMAINEGLRSK